MNGIRDFAARLINPPEDGNPVVMWFWNGEVTETGIRKYLTAFREQGINEFFIHPMYGLEVEYLSERFFELIRYAVSEAKRLKMRYWIYDEYNWPSGIAGGKVLREGNWAKSKVLSRVEAEVASGEEWSGTVEKFVAAHFRSDGTTEDVTRKVSFVRTEGGEKVTFKNDGGDGILYVTYRHVQAKVGCNAMWCRHASYEGGYVDVFNEKAIDKFIEYTYEEYKKAIGSEFGKTVRGIFNDEPAFTDFDDTSNGLIPWSESFSEQFKIRNCYDLLPKIYLLFENNRTEEELAVKRDYRDTAGELYRASYISRVSDWAKKNKLEFTAHLLGEEFLTAHTEQFGSFLEAERLLTVPAIDSVFSGEFINYERFNVSAAMLDSTAHWLGKSKTLCETYTGSGWELTLTDMKRIANRLMMQGVTTLMYMGAYNCLEGMKKSMFQCYPPSHAPNNILFRNYGLLTDYVSRLSAIVSGSEKSASMLVLYPSTTAAVTSDPHYIHTWEYSIKDFNDTTTYRQMDGAVTAVINALIRLKVTFEVAFEELFKSCRVGKGGIYFTLPSGEAGPYDTLVLPAVRYLRRDTARVIEEFISSGGRVILVNDIPEKEVDGFTPVKGFGLPKTDGFAACCASVKLHPDDKRTELFELAKNIRGIATNQVSLAEAGIFSASLSKALTTLLHTEPITVEGDASVLCFRRRVGTMSVCLIANDSDSDACAKITLGAEKKALIFDIDSGLAVSEFNKSTELTLTGHEGIAVFAGTIDEVNELGKCLEAGEMRLPLSSGEAVTDMEFTAADGNYLRLEWDICKDAVTGKGAELFANVTALPAASFRRERDKYNKPDAALCMTGDFDQNESYVMKTSFNIINRPKKTEIVCEKIYNQQFIINGKPLKLGRRENVYDVTNIVYDVSDFVCEGTNTLVVTGQTPDYPMPYTAPFAMVRGDFSLDSNGSIVIAVHDGVGDWTSSGYPFYSGMGIYEFRRRGTDKPVLELKTRDCAAVFVNSSFVGERAWPPYRFDLTHYLRKGENTVKIYITPTMADIFDKPVATGILEAFMLDKKQ